LQQTSKEGFSSTSSQAWQGENSWAATENVEKQALILLQCTNSKKVLMQDNLNNVLKHEMQGGKINKAQTSKEGTNSTSSQAWQGESS
jgi:hypothetical protein